MLLGKGRENPRENEVILAVRNAVADDRVLKFSYDADLRHVDCPVLSCPGTSPFFSMLRPNQTAGTIFTLYGSNDVFLRKDGPFGVRTMVSMDIWGNIPQRSPKMAVNKQFQAKAGKI